MFRELRFRHHHVGVAVSEIRRALGAFGMRAAAAFEGRPLAWLYLPNRHLVELLQSHV